ncbi:MAG: sugar phosphate isomerase/epimerase family protein, partial [Sediminibacterium sp.]
LLQSSLLMTGAMAGMSFTNKGKKPLMSFSTLGCPAWNFTQITSFAKQHDYQGLEMRGILKELYLPKCPEFASASAIKNTMQEMADKQLQFVDLGSSCNLHFAEGPERQKHLDEGKRFLDLAAAINCPNVRVYPNKFPKDQTKQQTMDLITKGLLELADYAKGMKVKVLMETHGEVVHYADLKNIMESAHHPQVGLIWDIANMWLDTGESPEDAYKALKPYIHHTHIKDAAKKDGKLDFRFLGEGEVPIFQAMDILVKDGYKGYFSFEWEKLWHPEIPEPELALADFTVKMKKHFGF